MREKREFGQLVNEMFGLSRRLCVRGCYESETIATNESVFRRGGGGKNHSLVARPNISRACNECTSRGFGYADDTLVSVIAPPAVCAANPKGIQIPAVAAATARIRLAVSGCSKCAVPGTAARKQNNPAAGMSG